MLIFTNFVNFDKFLSILTNFGQFGPPVHPLQTCCFTLVNIDFTKKCRGSRGSRGVPLGTPRAHFVQFLFCTRTTWFLPKKWGGFRGGVPGPPQKMSKKTPIFQKKARTKKLIINRKIPLFYALKHWFWPYFVEKRGIT